MEFGRGISIPHPQEGESFKFPATWIPAIPAKPVPIRPHMTTVTERSNWMGCPPEFIQRNPTIPNATSLGAASMGCPPEFLQRTATIPNVTSVEAATVFLNSAQPPTVDRHREMNNNWESALPAKRMSMANMNTYTQGMNNSNQLNQFNNLPFTELLAIADTASGFPRASATLANAVPASSAAGNGKAVGGNIMPGRPYFPFSLYEDDNNQLQSIPANLLMMGQNYMINSNQSSSNNQQQMSQNGFPDPHRSTYGQSSTSRTMYDLNCFPSTMGDAVSDGNLSFQCIPATPDKGSRMQHNYPSDAAQNSNISFQFGSGGQDMENRTLQNHPSAAGPSKNVSFQFASALDNSNRAENSQLLGAVSNCSTSSQFAPVTPDKGIILQSNHISEMVNNLREELINQEMSKSKDVNPCVNNLQMHSSQESCLESVVNSSSGVLEKPLQVGSSSADLSAPIKENNQPEKAENGIDLNKTPQQKPRRKKHRPRVVREDKRKNTPKSTEKQSSTKGTPERKKRKYVRKNASSTSKTPSTDVRRENHNGSNETPSTDVIGEITDSNQHATRRSCKRSLNFDSEVQGGESHSKMQRPRDEEHQRNNNNTSSSYAFNTISESQLHVRTKYNDILGDKCLQLSDGFGLTVQQTLADVALDLNQNAAQMLGDYISLPEIAPQAARREFPSPECTPQTPSREILRPECTSQPPRREILRPETTPQPTRRELLRQNLNLLARTASSTQAADKGLSTVRNCQPDIRQQGLINGILENHEHFVPTGLQRSIYEISKTQNNPDCSLNLPMAENRQETGSKRLHSQSIDERRIRSYNLIGPHINSLKTYYEMSEGSDELKKKAMLFPEIYKKRRTEKSQNTNTASKSHVATLGDYQKLTTEQITSQHYSVTPQLSTAQGNTDHHCNANGSESLRSGAWAPSHGYRSLSTPDGHSSHMQNIPAEPQRASDKQEPSELMLTIRQTGMKTGKRSKAHTRVRNLATLTSVTQCNNLQSPLRRNALTSHNRRVVETFQEIHDSMEPTHAFNNTNNQLRKYNRKGPHNVLSSSNGMRQQEHPPALLGYHHHSSMPRGSLEVTQQVDLPTAELVQSLVQRLNCLSISGERNIFSANEQNALVPFGGQNAAVQFGEQNALVPFEQHQVVTAGGTFALAVTVKRRPRPKVDLDEESNREWMRLMGKPSDGGEGMTPEKEKWWEEERRVLRSRADLFIARMHLIQGDRRFTKWNGSVLDSVIGVFLTQNVSDHLSSSAFMSLAARFPLKHNSDDKMCNEEGTTMYVEEPEMEVLNSDYTKWHQKMPSEPVKSQDTQGSVTLHGADHVEIREIGNGSDSSESNTGCGCSSGISDREFGMCQAAPETKTGSITTRTGCASFVETEYGRIVEVESSGISPQISVGSSLFDMNVGSTIVNNGSPTILETSRGALEDAISSENAAFLFTNTKDEIIRPFPYFSSSEDDLATRSKPDGLNSSTSFMELLLTRELCNPGNEGFGNSLKRDLDLEATKTIDLNTESSYDQLDLNDSERWNLNLTNSQSNSFLVLPSTPNFQGLETRITPSRDCNFQVLQKTGVINVQYPQLIGAQSSSSLTSTAAIREQKDVTIMGGVEANVGATLGLTEQKISLGVGATTIGSPYSSTNKQSVHQGISLKQQVHSDKQPNSWEHIQLEVNRMCQLEGDQSPESVILDGPGLKMDNKIQQAGSNSPNFSGETLDVVESTLLSDKKDSTENTDAESMTKEQVCSSQLTHEISTNSPISNAKHQKDKKKEVDWDHLRKEVYQRCGRKERTPNTKDSLDWEAVRCADVNVIANAIKERGMNNMLAARIKAFLNRLVTEHEDIDLEWLRDVPGDKAKDYLLSVRGLGLKSVECVRLLTLHHLAFPVDTNVGRIAVRLGWVPLQPLPESLQLHLLELYPVLETIQKYLWPRLCKLDQPTLYELHYQLITFGKVFCTKSRPNCNACPMRTECKHFASAYTSSRLKLGYKDETGVVSSTLSTTANQNPTVGGGPYLVLPPEAIMEAKLRLSSSEPIIEVPASPEPGSDEIPESEIGDIEDFDNDDFDNDDFGNEDPTDTNGLPTIFLNDEVGTFESNIRNCLDEQHVQLRDEESKALVAVNPQTASIPTIPLKNKSRLRTEHQVYELPDSHPLLEGVEKRVPGDVGFYLLAIWTPGETAESTEPPERCCSSQSSGGLCNEMTCFSCNSIREAHSQTVRGTILIPCRTAMRGSFPLNGTYFQVNEVFADHDSSLQPINVPRAWLWHLPRRTVYFGTSVTAIFRGQTTEEIQRCFWKGYVCVRGFDRKTRGPRPLIARLHLSASRQNKQKQEKTKR